MTQLDTELQNSKLQLAELAGNNLEDILSDVRLKLSEEYEDKLSTLSEDYAQKMEVEKHEIEMNLEQALQDQENQLEYR